MGILFTANQHVAYIDPLTPLTELAEATRLAAESVDAALMRGGFIPTPGYPRGRVATWKRTTAANFVANASGTGLQTPNTAEFLIIEGNIALAADRQYEVKMSAPQLGGVAGDRASLSLWAGGQLVQRAYTNLTGHGGPFTLPAPYVPTTSGTKNVRFVLTRDVGSGAFAMYADASSPMILTVDDIGAKP